MDTVAEGRITVAPEVLLDIVRQAILYLDDVVNTVPVPPRVDRLFRKVIIADGIELEIKQGSVVIDLYLVTRPVNLTNLCHRVQKEVMRAMDKLVGLKVSAVNIHIEDIAYPVNGSS